MANTILHKADSRGDANHGWLHSRHTLSAHDGFGIWDVSSLSIQADSDAEILLMEVPMTV